MPTCEEIRADYQAQHDELSESYYAGTSGLTKEEFDTLHGAIWAAMEAELIAEGCRQPPVEPLAFNSSPPGSAPGARLKNVEDFLREAYPGR